MPAKNIFLHESLIKAAERLAKKEHRSFSSFIAELIREEVKRQKK